tara:strand:+ start:219 stop:722 length:504 start_codon:yes stop_codon:yes gene_type:complete
MVLEKLEPTVGYEGLYKTSSLGRLWSMRLNRFLNPKPTKYGYIRVDITDNKGVEKSLPLHRLVALSFIPNPLNKKFINHKNGIKTDNRVENLEWCTILENTTHAFELGLRNGIRGEKSNLSKLTEKDVLEIRSLFVAIKSYKKISVIYNTSLSNIYHIVNKSTWKHI